MPNAYLQKQQALQQAIFEAGQDVGFQKAMDYVQCVLHDEEVMRGKPFGRDRISAITRAVMERDKLYSGAYTAEKEADVLQEHLDRELREIYGDELPPFAERQPWIKQYGYGKAKKGWV